VQALKIERVLISGVLIHETLLYVVNNIIKLNIRPTHLLFSLCFESYFCCRCRILKLSGKTIRICV